MTARKQRRRVLCIEADATSLLIRKYLLEQAGYEVFTSTDFDRGWRLMQEQDPQLLVIDEPMARVALSRNGKVVRAAPVLLLSDMQWPEERLRSWADDYFWRADSTERLLEKVHRFAPKKDENQG